jgi:pheromone shutdown protein TraB
VTLKRVLKQLSWLERLRAVSTMTESSVRGLFTGRRRARQAVEDELARYSHDPDKALMELGRRFPTVRRVVIDERDDFMARRIRTGLAGIGLGIAVVGDGHVPGLLRRLHDVEITPYRLPDVRAGTLPRPAASTRSVSFGFQLDAGGSPGARDATRPRDQTDAAGRSDQADAAGHP